MDFITVARSLGVRVQAPWRVQVDERWFEFAAFFPDFGSPKGIGIVFGDFEAAGQHVAAAQRLGIGWSCLYSTTVKTLQSVKNTLDDWRYCGPPEAKPAWYTGIPWSQQPPESPQ